VALANTFLKELKTEGYSLSNIGLGFDPKEPLKRFEQFSFKITMGSETPNKNRKVNFRVKPF